MYPKIELDLMLTDEVVNIVKEGIDLAIRGAPLADSALQALVKLAVLSDLYYVARLHIFNDTAGPTTAQ